MDRFLTLYTLVGFMIAALIAAGLYADALNAFLQRHIPQLRFDGETLLIWGMLVMVAFIFGLSVMFMVLYP